ncbi:MAG: hypothetical protein KDC67_09295 [Ignavibacteriae bacterium]|nr:hypothetical protein [Ignavibacteriota bacterium]
MALNSDGSRRSGDKTVNLLKEDNYVQCFEHNYGDKLWLYFRLPNGKDYEVKIRSKDIYSIRESLVDHSREIHKFLKQNKDKSIELFKKESFQDFLRASNRLYKIIFSEERNGFFETLKSISEKPSKIEFHSKRFTTPVEFINVSSDIENPEILADYFVTYRLSENNKMDNSNGRINLKSINLSYFANTNLVSVKTEEALFEELIENDSRFINYIYHKNINNREHFFEKSLTQSSNIIHLSCHLIPHRRKEKYTLKFRDYSFQLDQFMDEKNKNMWCDKILFANTCYSGQSADEDEDEYEKSIFDYFIETGVSSLICVGLKIYDDFAGDFTKKFYSNLLTSANNQTLQHTLYMTADEYWKNERNPIGLFYFCIGPAVHLNLN